MPLQRFCLSFEWSHALCSMPESIGMREWRRGSIAAFALVTVWALICRYSASFPDEMELPCGCMMLPPMNLRD